MSLNRGVDPSDPLRAQPVTRLADWHEERRSRSWRLATGTLACPHCDAPVAPGPQGLRPADPIACPYCDHAGRTREFLSLGEPSRPARVSVRVVDPRRVRT